MDFATFHIKQLLDRPQEAEWTTFQTKVEIKILDPAWNRTRIAELEGRGSVKKRTSCRGLRICESYIQIPNGL